VTQGPSSAVSTLSPYPTTTAPEYETLHYLDVELREATGGDWINLRALLDTGSQGDCINQELSENHLTNHCLKPKPATMVMADGTHSSAGQITHYDPVVLRTAGHEEQASLDIASLSHGMILGMPWHKKHNPRIDYPNDVLTFCSDFCRENCSHYGKSVPL